MRGSTHVERGHTEPTVPRRRITFFALSLLLASTLLIVFLERGGHRVAFVGGPVLTMDASGRIVEGLAVDGNRIAAVGSRAEILAWASRSAADVVELEGRALMPGFIEAHGHFPGMGLYTLDADLNSPPIGSVRSIEDLVGALRKQASATPRGDWVVGISYDDTLLAERRHPTRADLDRASSEHPVVAWHVSLHLAVVNTRALETLGIEEQSPDPDGGHFGRDPRNDQLDGLLEENATNLVRDTLDDPSPLAALKIARAANRVYLRNGVTTAQTGYANERLVTGLPLLSRLGLIDVRLIVWPDETVIDHALANDEPLVSYDREWVTFGAAKLIADGSIQGYTAYLSEPYYHPPGNDPTFRGYPRMTREELFARIERFQRAGLQVAVHGNGDAAIDDILDAFENAQRVAPRADTRHVIVHAQTARDDQLDRMARLGVIPSFFVLHTYYWGDRHRDIFLGPARAARISPLRSAGERGLRYTIHADSPVVPMEPLRLVWSAVERRTTSGAILGPEQRVSALDALRAVTIDAARQHFEENEKGSLEVGKLADLVVLSASPLEPGIPIDEIRVVETIIGGRSLFRADDAPTPLAAVGRFR